MAKPLFRWLHLSDIHVGHGDAAHGLDQRLVLDSLRRDVSGSADAILVTGDVAFSGADRSATEYTRAREWLLDLGKALGVGAAQIFVVPGNHDVSRSADKDHHTRRLVSSLRSGKEPLDTALGHAGDRAMLAGRMAAYLDFSAGFAPACLGAVGPAESRLHWTHRLQAQGGLAVRLLGLNSALLAADDLDQGRLALGLEQITLALTGAPIEAHELVIALIHHPLRGGWMVDEKAIDARLQSQAHVLLSGHVHEADAEQARSGAGGTFVRVAAGATHGEAARGVPPSHGYSFGEVVASPGGKARLRVFPRRWSPKLAAFVLDADNVPEGHTHASFGLPIVLPRGGHTAG
jgi:hypothetical protein